MFTMSVLKGRVTAKSDQLFALSPFSRVYNTGLLGRQLFINNISLIIHICFPSSSHFSNLNVQKPSLGVSFNFISTRKHLLKLLFKYLQ